MTPCLTKNLIRIGLKIESSDIKKYGGTTTIAITTG